MRLSHHLSNILLAQAVALAASASEPAPEAAVHHAPDLDSPIRELGRQLKRALGIETRDEITYYGDYGAYGEYGSYGSYPDDAAESSSSSSGSSALPPTTTTTTSTTTLTTSITLSMATASTASSDVSIDRL